VDPLGRFLYVANDDAANLGDISGFSINTSTGALSTLAGFPLTPQNSSLGLLAVDPSGKFLYVSGTFPVGSVGYCVFAYAIDETTGVLTPVPGSPFPVGGTAIGGGPVALTVTREVQ
jgi:6-phosphogluconolactonase